MEGERDVTEELDEGAREKLSASPKAKRIASPRWSKHETMVMIEAKRKHEVELQKGSSNGGGLNKGGQGQGQQHRPGHQLTADFNKWDLVSASCRAVGIDRDGKMCRKRWFNLLTEFKKIRDWCKTNRVEEFWSMSGDERREKKLPTGFDQEIYKAMETFDSPAGLQSDAFNESATTRGAAATDDGLFSELDHDVVQPVEDVLDDGRAIVVHGTGNGLPPKPLFLTGIAPERPRNVKKRKLPSATPPVFEAEPLEPKDPYIAMLETTSRTLQAAFTESMQAQIKMYSRTVHAQIEAQKQENELERALRKEQGDKLIGVLTTLVETLSKIAEKL